MLIPFDYLIKKYNCKPTGVLHIGANEGQEAEDYHKLGIEKMIFIEAIPEVCEKLRSNLSSYPKAVALNACVSDIDGQEVEFNISSNQGQSSSFLEFGTHAIHHDNVTWVDKVKMTTIRMDSLISTHTIKDNGYNFLNIDLQGAELLALKGMGDMLKNFDYAYIEVNKEELYKGCPMVEEIDEYLAKFGFTRVETKWTNWNWGDAFYIKK